MTPTAGGARLNLAPGEVPTDRVVELSQQLEAAIARNRDLLARIRELEAIGAGREQSLAEAVREADAAAADLARAKTGLQAARAEAAALQAQVRQMEKEDVEMLRAVIAALERLLPPPASRKD